MRAQTDQPTGKALLQASWGLLKQDRELLWLPVLASVFGLIAAVVLFAPGFALGWVTGGDQVGGWVGGLLAALGTSAVATYFQVALVIGANERAEGGDPTLRSVLTQAWTLKGRIFAWALLSTTVGTVVRSLEQRLGLVGKLLGFLAGLAWAIASFLVVPVLVAENLGPVDAVKRSGQLIKSTWGTGLRTTLRFGLIQLVLFLPAIAIIVIGAVAISTFTTAGAIIGTLLVLAGVLGLLALSMVFSAITSYARALIYRYAVGRAVPGIDPALFGGVFQQSRRARRRLA